MQAAPARYVSVSELYSTDEVELLLEEIRELEPTSCCADDIQDFEIAGSQTGATAGGGGRSPVGTEHSWDSHAHYRRAPPPPPQALAPIYCHVAHLGSLRGVLQLLIVACGAGACGCMWAGVGLRPWLLPLPARARLLLLAALSSALLHALLLLMHVTKLAALLPLHWTKIELWTSVWSGAALSGGGALVLHAVVAAPEYRWTPPPLARLLLAAAALCVSGGALSAALCAWLARRCPLLRPAPLPPTPRSPAGYRAVPQPSTSDQL